MAKLGDICEILDNKRIPITASDRIAGPYPYYGANGVQDYVSDFIFDDELVLLAEDGGYFGSKDRPIAYRVSGKCWVNNHAHVLKPKRDVDVNYLCYSLMLRDVSKIVNGATRQKLTQADMRKIDIPLPSMHEQKIIAETLNKLTVIIDLRKRQLSKLDDLVKSQFMEMFGDPVMNPMGWPLVPLLETGTCKNGMNFGSEEAGVEIHCLGVGNFKNLSVIDAVQNLPTISLIEMPSSEYLLRDEDIVFVRSNGNSALVGRCLAIYPGNTQTTFSGFCIRYRKNTITLLTEYLLQTFKAPSIRQQMFGRGANIQNLNQQILSQLNIPIPPLMMQNEFVTFVQQTDKSKFIIQQSLDKLNNLYKSLMQLYFG